MGQAGQAVHVFFLRLFFVPPLCDVLCHCPSHLMNSLFSSYYLSGGGSLALLAQFFGCMMNVMFFDDGAE